MVHLQDDDQAGAFRHCKHAPIVIGLHCAILFGWLIAWTGQTFGSAASPGNYEPISNVVQQIAEHIWAIPDLVELARPFLPQVTLEPEPSAEVCATFKQANVNALNPGVLDDNGNCLPPPFVHHVDDKMYADVAEFMFRTIAAAVLAIYELLGYPLLTSRLHSLEKFKGHYTHHHKELGYLIYSRTLIFCRTTTLPQVWCSGPDPEVPATRFAQSLCESMFQRAGTTPVVHGLQNEHFT